MKTYNNRNRFSSDFDDRPIGDPEEMLFNFSDEDDQTSEFDLIKKSKTSKKIESMRKNEKK